MRNPVARLTAWRFKRWQAYLARHASKRDEGSEHYYNKIYNYNIEKTARVRAELSELIGAKTATRLLLLDSWQTRLPWRTAYGAWLLTTTYTSAWTSLPGGVLAVFALVPVIALGNFTGERAAKRVLERHISFYDDPLAVLVTLNRTGRFIVRRNAKRLPAKVLAAPSRGHIRNVLSALNANELETVEKLSPEFEGTVGELLTTAKLIG